MSILQIVPSLVGLAPAALALIGAVVVSLTALQSAALAAQGFAKILPVPPGVAAFFGGAAHVLGVGALDLQKAASVLGKVVSLLGRFGKGAATGGLVLLLACTGCASFLHFSNPGTQAVTCGVSSRVLPCWRSSRQRSASRSA